MQDELIFSDICTQLNLGSLIDSPLKLYGGFMHKMFRIRTSHGLFAIKLLNPMIMKRPDALSNFQIAESLEFILQHNNIPIIPAIEYNGIKMQCCNNQYYYIFKWVDGKALKSQDVTKQHCIIVGNILAKIHNIDTKAAISDLATFNIDWHYYINFAQKEFPRIARALSKNLNILIASQEDGNFARNQVPNIVGICHGDMDSKNVLWHDDEPKIIDLECLNYGNPYIELFELALQWSGYEQCNIDYHLLEAFIKAYIDARNDFKVDWNILYCNNNARLLWLEYNVKRALMIECENEEEQKLGIKQIKGTMKLIVYYHSIKDTLIKKLSQLFPFKI